MAIAFVDTTVTASGATVSSINLAAQNLVGGNANIVCFEYNTGTTVSTVTDTAGNSYTQQGVEDPGSGFKVEIWAAFNVSGNASNVVTITLGAAVAHLRGAALQYSGIATSSALDVTATGTAAAATSCTSGSFTPTNANDVAIALNSTSVNVTGVTAGAGYTVRVSDNAQLSVEENIGTGTSSQTASISWTTAANARMIVCTFKPFVATLITVEVPNWEIPNPIKLRPISEQFQPGIFTQRPSAPAWYGQGNVFPEWRWPAWNPDKSLSVTPMGIFSSGPPMDAGWPVTTVVEAFSGSTIVAVVPSTKGPDRLIYVAVSFYSATTTPGPITVSGLGLSWFKIVSADAAAPFLQEHGAEIWAAWAHSPIPGGSIQVGLVNPGPVYAVITSYARYNTAGAGVASAAFGSTASKTDVSGASTSRDITVTGTQTGSAFVLSEVDGTSGGISPEQNTLIDGNDTAAVTLFTATLSGAAGGGSITFGMNGTTKFYDVVAAEILQVTTVNRLNSEFFGPFGFMRPFWTPEKSMMFLPAKIIPTPPLIPTPSIVTPDMFMRPLWVPERSLVSYPWMTNPVIVPRSPVPPVLPERYIRTQFDPGGQRTKFFEPNVVAQNQVFATLVTLGNLYVNEPFNIFLIATQPLQGVAFVLQIIPYAIGPITFGNVQEQNPASIPSLPTRLTNALSAGLIPLFPNKPVTFLYQGVAFKPGTYILQAVVILDGGTRINAVPLSVNVVSVTG